MMKKRLISILLVCMVSLMSVGSALAVFDEPIPMRPGTDGFRPDHETWKRGFHSPNTVSPNPLPSNPMPIPNHGEHGYHGGDSFERMVKADLDLMISRLAAKYNASAEALSKYMQIAPYSFSKLSAKDQKALKKLMMKMAAKELGISVSKLEGELKRMEEKWVRKLMHGTGRSESEIRSHLHRHANHSLFHSNHKNERKDRHNMHKDSNKHKHDRNTRRSTRRTYRHAHRNTGRR